MSWKPLAACALLAGYAVTCVFGVPATRRSFLEAWLHHRLAARVQEGHPRFTSEETEDLKRTAEGILSVHRVIPVFPGILMVEYEESHAFGGVGGRALTFWYPASLHVIVDAG